MRRVAVPLVLAMLWLAAPAHAAAVQPAPGASVRQDQAVLFDWERQNFEVWTAEIVFTQVADADDPIWSSPGDPGRIAVTDAEGDGWPESQAVVDLARWPFTPGQWYWRPCNRHADGPPDRCYQLGDPTPITIMPRLVPPASPAPAAPPQSPAPAASGSAARIPTLALADARRYVTSALRRRFAAFRHARGRRVSACARRSRLRIRCRASWHRGDARWAGHVTVWRTREDGNVVWDYAYTIRRTHHDCRDAGDRSCTRVYRVR